MLNVNQILEEGLLKLEHTLGKPAQVGYDLALKQVDKVGGNGAIKMGKVLKDKTELTTYTPIPLANLDGVTGWILYNGVYSLTFAEGCKIPANRVGFIKQRSSLYRNGVIINSPVFDPGFETTFMGTLAYVHESIFIEEGARVAQIYFHECTPLEEGQLYAGQFQGDKQRK
jgi:deoxycytidine triphosphate deaminase